MTKTPSIYIIHKRTLPRALKNKKVLDLVPKDISGIVVEESDVTIIVDDQNFNVIQNRLWFCDSGPIEKLGEYLLNFMPNYYDQSIGKWVNKDV